MHSFQTLLISFRETVGSFLFTWCFSVAVTSYTGLQKGLVIAPSKVCCWVKRAKSLTFPPWARQQYTVFDQTKISAALLSRVPSCSNSHSHSCYNFPMSQKQIGAKGSEWFMHVGAFAAWQSPAGLTRFIHSNKRAWLIWSMLSLGKMQQALNLGMREGRSLLMGAKAISATGSERPFLKQRTCQRESRSTTPGAWPRQVVET